MHNGTWVGQPSASGDHVVKTRSFARFTDVVNNGYRVLLTRGLESRRSASSIPKRERT